MKQKVEAENAKPRFYANGEGSVIQRGAYRYNEEKGTMSCSMNSLVCFVSEHLDDMHGAGLLIAEALNRHDHYEVMLKEMQDLAKALEDVADVPQSFYNAIADAEEVMS